MYIYIFKINLLNCFNFNIFWLSAVGVEFLFRGRRAF